MRTATLVLASLTALTVAVAADPASAATNQTAKDLTVKKKDVKGGFERIVSPGLQKGPFSEHLPCGVIKLVPRGGTLSTEEFQRESDVTADGTQVVVDTLSLSTVLTPSVASATALIKGFKAADRRCAAHIAAAPKLKDGTHGFLEVDSYDGATETIGTTDVPMSGSSQVLIYQRGRAMAIVQLDRSLVVGSADGSQISSITHLVTSDTRSVLKANVTLALTALGRQASA
jgi:hypothetical protein